MTKAIKNILTFFHGGKPKTSDDLSDFFNKPAWQRVKVMRKILREANDEQREVVRKYHDSLNTN